MVALITAGFSPFAYIAELRRRLAQLKSADTFEHRLAEIESRLRVVETGAETASAAVGSLRAEREFDRRLLGERAGEVTAQNS